MNGYEQYLSEQGMTGSAGGDWCFGSLQVCAYRITQLNSNGTAWAGANHGLANNTLIDATVEVDLEAGADLTMKNGCGSICQTFKDCDRIKGVNITLNLCALDSKMIQMMVGGWAFIDSTGAGAQDVIGYELPASDEACTAGVALELWTKAWSGSSQAAPAFASGSPVYFHWVFPKTTWSIGSLNMEDDFMTVPLIGYGVANARMSANGPYDDWPVDIAAGGGINNAGGWFFDTTIPTASCELITVSSAAS